MTCATECRARLITIQAAVPQPTPVTPALTTWLIPPTAAAAIPSRLKYVAASFTRSFRVRNMLDFGPGFVTKVR